MGMISVPCTGLLVEEVEEDTPSARQAAKAHVVHELWGKTGFRENMKGAEKGVVFEEDQRGVEVGAFDEAIGRHCTDDVVSTSHQVQKLDYLGPILNEVVVEVGDMYKVGNKDTVRRVVEGDMVVRARVEDMDTWDMDSSHLEGGWDTGWDDRTHMKDQVH